MANSDKTGFKYRYLKGLHGVEFPSDTYYRVLVTLLDYANPDGTSAHPGNEVLASDCCCHPETVRRALQWHRKHGFIGLDRRGSRHGGASVWRFPGGSSKGSTETAFTASPKGSTATALRGNQKATPDTVSPGSKGNTAVLPHQISTRETQGDDKVDDNRVNHLAPTAGASGALPSRVDGARSHSDDDAPSPLPLPKLDSPRETTFVSPSNNNPACRRCGHKISPDMHVTLDGQNYHLGCESPERYPDYPLVCCRCGGTIVDPVEHVVLDGQDWCIGCQPPPDVQYPPYGPLQRRTYGSAVDQPEPLRP